MQVEHIDENTIRVRINKQELADRGLKVLDLLGNKEMIQHFFYSILDEVDTDHSFTKSTPVSFQIMPNSSGLDLLISKVKDNNDTDTLQKMLGMEDQSSADNTNKADTQRSFFDLNPDDDEKTEGNPAKIEETSSFSSPQAKNAYWKFQTKQFYQFKDLGEIVELANSLRANDLASSLYLFKGAYFLKLVFLNEDYLELKPADAWAIANEYGIKINDQQMKVVEDEGNCIMERDALGNLRHYFNN